MLESTDVARRAGSVPWPRRCRRHIVEGRVSLGRDRGAAGAADERRAGRAARHQRGVDRLADRDPSSGRSRDPTSGCRTTPRAQARRRSSAPGVDGSELDLVLVATLTADEVTPNAAPLVAHALGADRAGAFDVGCGVHRVPVGRRDRSRRRSRAGARVGCWSSEPTSSPGCSTGRTARARRCSATPPARRCSARPTAARRDRPDRARRRRLERRDDLHPQPRPQAPDGRPGGLQARGRADGGVDAGGARPRRDDDRRHRPVRLPPGQRPDHARARRALWVSSPSGSSTASRTTATRRRRRCRWRSRSPSATAG